ncbi:amino acid adenylation domain-containing protein, partial [Gordonia defluvii]|uniref:amino acid adenylation domain-containing protein n=1 Tax=Gordonia defluvii TaxID=283718 RepID=UPI0031D6CCA4
PEYMRPSVWTVLDRVVLGSAGKLDRKALPAPDFSLLQAEYVAPESGAEAAVAAVFAEVLGVERVSVTESFFGSGGNSLSAMRLVARVGESLGVEVSVRDVFDAPTVRELVAAVADRAPALPPVTAVVPRPAEIPLSFAQKRMWFINQLNPASATYNLPLVLRLSGRLDVSALRSAVGDLVARHEILRTRFPAVDSEPRQVIVPAVEADIDWQVVDSQAAIESAIGTGFDVSTDLPLRVRLWPVSAEEHVLAVVMQHIASDGESTAPLIADLVSAYQARHDQHEPAMSPLAVQFADFALWQHRVLGSPDDPGSVVGRQLTYWTEQLAGLPDVMDLPTDRPRPAVASQHGARWEFEIPADTAAQIGALAQQSGATAFMVVHSALAVLLSRLTVSDDIGIGTPIAGRGQPVLDPLIGMFVNTLVLRTKIDADSSFAQVLADAKAVDLDAFANADVPFETVVEAVGATRSASFAPLSQVWLTLDRMTVPELAGANVAVGEVAGLRVSPMATDDAAARVDLLVSVVPADGAWRGSITYAADLFDETTVASLARRLVRVFDSAVADPDAAVGDIALDDAIDLAALTADALVESTPVVSAAVADEEAAKAVVTGGPGRAPALLSELFVAAARQHGMRQAVVDASGEALTYAELDARSNRLARWLTARGVGADDRVALAIGRSASLLTAIWAVAKAGAAYVPIDPDYPAERIAMMVEDCGAVLGIALAATRDLPEQGFEWARIDDAAVSAQIAALSDAPLADEELVRPVRIDNTAYLIYTSGSTGRPKGVAVSHAGLANFGHEEVRRSGVDEYSRVLGFASPSFDASILEYLLSTVSGGVLVYRPSDAIGGPVLADYLTRQAVTHAFLTPTVLATLDPTVLPTLRAVYVGGEAVPATLVDQWALLRRVQAMYGPTEATVAVSMSSPMQPGQPVSMGGVINGVGFVVLDHRMRPVPVGVPGDLYILGPALARGYHGRSDLTADRFVATAFGPAGTRMYRTGDVVRWRQDSTGQLVAEYSGRSDDQVKLRGLRIELGEIDAALAAHPAVRSAVVVGVGADGQLVDSGESVISGLAGYVVLAEPVEMTELRATLVERLPEYMVPASLTEIDALPMTPAGKLDRRALPAPELGMSAGYEPPRTEAETQLAAIVGGLLGIEQVSVTESFFALGGDSIMSIQLASAAKAAGMVVSPREIFEYKTIRAIAEVATDASAQLPDLVEPDEGDGDRVPLTPVVSWMLDLSDTPDDFADFSQSVVLVAPAELTSATLGEVVEAVVAAHPMLGAALTQTDGDWQLRTGVGRSGVAELTSAHRVGDDEFDADLVRAFEAASARLAPGVGRNVEAVLVRDAEGPARVVLVIHHLVVDAVSWRAVVEDLLTAWAQHSAGQPYSLRPEATSMRAWAMAQAERAADRRSELDYWLPRARVTDLGVELDRGRDREHTVQTVIEDVPADVTEAILTRVPAAFGGAVNDPLVAALARAVRSWQHAHGIVDEAPVALLVEGHGRYEEVLAAGSHPVRADLSRTVGWFTTIAPISVDPGVDVEHAVKAAKEERVNAPDRGIGFGLLRFGASPELAERPLPAISLNYLGNIAGGDEAVGDLLPAADAPRLPGTVRGAMVATNALTINVSTVLDDDGGRRFSAAFGFPGALLESSAVADLARRWTDELTAIVAHVDAVGDPGLSPSDVVGVEVSQHDLDTLARRYPGAAVWQLSPLQRGLAFQAEIVTGADAAVDVYVAQAVLQLDGNVDIDRLHGAAQGLLEHHRVLRSGFVRTSSGTVVAVVPPSAEVGWRVVDLMGTTSDVVAQRVAEIADAEQVNPFDLSDPPLIRFVAVRTESGVRLVVTSHHILVDGWSSPLVIADLLALYATGSTYTGQVNTSGNDFADFLALPPVADDAESMAAWRNLLLPLEEPTLVAANSVPTSDQLPRDRIVVLDPELSAAIEDAARTRGVTVAVIMQFAWAVLLSRLTGNRIVAFGETVSGRPANLEGVEAMVGLFINTLPAVVDVDPDATIGEVLDRIQTAKVSVLDHQHVSLSEIMAAAGVPVLFDTLAVHESYPVNTDSIAGADPSGTGDLTVADVWARDATHYPLSFVTSESGDSFVLKVKYLPAVFDDRQIEVLTDTLRQILTATAGAATTRVAEISLLGADEAAALTPVSGGVGEPPVVLAGLFARAAQRWPERVAVVDGSGAALTYAELDQRSNQLARWLVDRGIGVESLVALAIPRSVELLTAIWAVAKTGGGYVPIDPDYPAERIAAMVEDSGAVLGLAVRAAGELPDEGFEWVHIDRPDAVAEIGARDSGSPVAVRAEARPHNTAYVIYTSGSTGRPKGVAVTHTGLANFSAQEARRLKAGDAPVVLGFASPSFDASVLEYLLATEAGGTLAYRPSAAMGGPELQQFMRDQRITHTFLTPTVLSTLEPADLPDLLHVAAGGEVVPRGLVEDWLRYTRLHNVYGPTETTILITISDPIEAGQPVWMGGPMPGVDLMVLDERLRPVPVGIRGELYVMGGALSRGYLDQAPLTAGRFVATPFGTGERMYRTGDIVSWRVGAAGELVLEYNGRGDDQVKLRGLRIELGEIESALTTHAAVDTAVVVGVGGSVATALAAYVVGGDIDVAELKSFLGERLPSHMVPASIMVLDALPLTPVGKLDKRALPEPIIEVGEFVAPATEVEVTVAGVFADVLDVGVDEVSVTASFFELGGNSLSATRVAARLAEALDADVSVRDLFTTPTVRALAAGIDAGAGGLPPVTAVVPRPDRVPLSFAQQRMWFINRLEPDLPTYNIPAVLRLTGALDVAALRAAVGDVVARHEVLRTTFPDVDGVPFQDVAATSSIQERLDWQVVDSREQVEAVVVQGFDVSTQWPIRVRLWQAGESEFVLALVVHHIAADGESMQPLVTDVVTAYAARAAGESSGLAPLDVQVADFAIWQHKVLGSPEDAQSVVGRQLQYWQDQLAGAPDVLELPLDRPRPRIASHRGGRVEFEIPASLGDRIIRVAKDRDVTPFMVLHAGLAVLLGRLGATDDVSVATPIAGRGQQILDPLVGMFVNTLVLRTRTRSGLSFTDLLAEVRQIDLEAFAHADAPFETVVERVDPVRSEAFPPLAQVILSVTHGGAELPEVMVGDLSVSPVAPAEAPAQYDVNVAIVVDPGNAWRGTLLYATELFDESTIDEFGGRLAAVLEQVTTDPSRAIGDLEVLTSRERTSLAQLPAPTVPAEAGRSLVDLFADVVAVRGGSRAVSAGDSSLTYTELDERSDAIAAGLVAAGVGSGDLVGLATARSVNLVAAIVGVLKVGAAYLPLDTTNPVDRLAYIVGDSGVRVVLNDASTADSELWSHVGEAAVLDVDDLTRANAGVVFTPVPILPAARAYVIYTSGSTGRPKGVEVTHGDVGALMGATRADFEFRPDDVWTMFHSYAFDFSVWELWGPLLSGARLVVVDRELARDIDAFVGLLAAEGVTFLNLTPSAFYQLIDARRRRPDAQLALRYIVFGGEELGFEQVRRWFDENPDDDARLINMYGITETTVHVSFRDIERDVVSRADPSYIGRPLSSLAIHILDDRLQPVPQGVVGEMYVAGAQLAQGYLNRPELTVTRFVADPFGRTGGRLYRTGDLARRSGDDIEYLGRADGQIQLRGFRIEYGEVEEALLGVDGVVGSAARVISDEHRGDLLIGYLVVEPGAVVDAQQARDQAGARVPRYMVPDLVMIVDRLPLTANGKLDRSALPLPAADRATEDYTAPQGPGETAVAAVFAGVLGVERVSVTESFFDAGGNSLSAMRLVARVGEALDAQVSVRDVFDAPSVRELVAAVADRAPALPPVTAVVPRPDEIPLSFAQQRMWFINQFDPALPTYNIPAVMRLSGEVDVDALRAALADVVVRHEVLRTRFPAVDGVPRQVVAPVAEATADLPWLWADSVAVFESAVTAGFDVTVDLPIRAVAHRVGESDLLFAVVVHHIAADGESMLPLVSDVVAAYAARAAGGSSSGLAELDVQFADYALWQHEVLGSAGDPDSVAGGQLAFWRERLAELPDVLELPADRPRPAVASYRGAEIGFEVPALVAERVAVVARERGVTPFMVVHAALAVVLA